MEREQMKSKCEKFRQYISMKTDGELSKSAEKELSLHLKTCEECRNFQNNIIRIHKLTQNIYSEIQKKSEQESMWDQISAQLPVNKYQPQPVKDNKVIPLKPARKKWDTWLSSALAAGFALFFIIYLFISGTNQYNKKRNECVVDWVESKKSSVMVYKDDDTNTTIIWMFSALDDNRLSEG